MYFRIMSSFGTFTRCTMGCGILVHGICRSRGDRCHMTFDSCVFACLSTIGVRPPHAPVKILTASSCALAFRGKTVLRMAPLDGAHKGSILCSVRPGTLLNLKCLIVVSSATPMSFPSTTKLFGDGALSMPIVVCVDQKQFNMESLVGGTTARFASPLLLRDPKFTMMMKSNRFASLLLGLEVVCLMQKSRHNGGLVDIQHMGSKKVIITWCTDVDGHTTIIGNGGLYGENGPKIIVLSPAMVVMTMPVTVVLRGLRLKRVSIMSPNEFTTEVSRTPIYKISPYSGDSSKLVRWCSFVLGCETSMVQMIGCSLNMDSWCCSENVGVCVVEHCSSVVFRHCKFGMFGSRGLIPGPGCSVWVQDANCRVSFQGCEGVDSGPIPSVGV